MLSGRFEEITKKEYKEFAGAMKTAESKCNRFGAKDMAYALRRVLYHADEEGLPFLTDKEVDAIAAFYAYTVEYKNARISKNCRKAW